MESKVNRRTEIFDNKDWSRINEIEKRKKTNKEIHISKNCLFDKISKIDKPLARLT